MIEIMNGGLYTTVQDYPGRVGYWNVGIPPSGPMDSLAFRIGNRLVGNSDAEAGLEITVMGPTIKFKSDAMIALTGAKLKGSISGKAVPWWQSIYVEGGEVLNLGAVQGPGSRTYLAVRGGIDVPEYLGSKSTFPKGHFGGYEGRPLTRGDFLRVNKKGLCRSWKQKLVPASIPQYGTEWEVGTIPGPHTAPDFFTPADIEMFYNTKWRVHRNSNRLGYRLEGPRPKFARKDGGEGGRHPSNVHDYAYAIGTINFTGDMPIILTVDGPSLGGFVSLATIATSELWKIGQAKPHDYLVFIKMTLEQAIQGLIRQERALGELATGS
jgi:urea carboxylase